MRKFFLTTLLLASTYLLFAGSFADPHQINRRLGRGINMGNTFEAPTETEWGNPWKPEYFRIMKELGFSHVRIPIRWATAQRSMETAPYTIYPDFMNRIKAVVDTALKYQLHPIINMHHHEKLFEDPDGQKDRFLMQWVQIADFFKDYSDSLVFEVLNEPHNQLTPDKWNLFFAEALGVIRLTNPQRTVLVGTAEWGGLGGLSKLQLPNDNHLILTVHYYNPFQFTHQGASWSGEEAKQWLGTKWNDTEPERQTVIDEFAYAIKFSQEKNIPIHVGEFGAYSTADIESRVKWTRFLARWFDQQGFSWAYWEFSAGFGIYNPSTKKLLDPLVDALLNSELPEPTGMIITPLFQNNFQNSTDGWNHWNNSGAQSAVTTGNGFLKVDITNGGGNSWNIQLAKLNLKIEKGKMYRVTFEATANAYPRNLTCNVGKASDPWTSYGSTSVTLIEDGSPYRFSFTSSVDDNSARMTFDLGASDIGITLSYVALESLALDIEEDNTSTNHMKTDKVSFFPNPTTNQLTIKNISHFNLIQIYDMKGRLKKHQLLSDISRIDIDVEMYPIGLYFVKLTNDHQSHSFKFQKA